MAKTSPSLSTRGWLTTPSDILDNEFGNFLLNEYSQTHMYVGHIASFPYLVQRYGHDRFELNIAVQDTLRRLLECFFDTVSVEAIAEQISPDDDSKYYLRIAVTVIHEGLSYNLSKETATVDSKTKSILDTQRGIKS